jgi:hypothetical protein
MVQYPLLHFFVPGDAGCHKDFVSGKRVRQMQRMTAFPASASADDQYGFSHRFTSD